MLDGLWTVIFNLAQRQSSMVITVNDGRLTGGNTEYYYIGTLVAEDAKFTGKIEGKHYFANPDPLLDNAKVVRLKITGSVENGVLQGQATIEGMNLTVPFVGTKRI
jgi:hypothetical protein